jgi:succinylglutamate desuccinylase
MLNELYELPEGLLDQESRDLEAFLGGPTLIHLPGHREPPLFLSVLLHGNETGGWDALRALLRQRRQRLGQLKLPRALSFFIGNVAAAAQGLRHLPRQPDYNRVWPGSDLATTPEHDLMLRVVAILRDRGLFASIDLHNTTGINPHYGCVTDLDQPSLHLAALFSRTLVYVRHTRGVQTLAMRDLCPAVTLECGKVGDKRGIAHAQDYIDACLHLAELPGHPVAPQDIDLYHTVAKVQIRADRDFAYPPGQADLILSPDLESFNFCQLPPGTRFGRITQGQAMPLVVSDARGGDMTARYFHIQDDELRLSRTAMPSLITHDETIIRQDCLCYLMEPYSHPVRHRQRSPL